MSIGLRPDVLEAPTLLDVAYLEVMMLWPGDPTKRELALQAIAVRVLTDTKAWPIPSSPEQTSELVSLVQNTPKSADLIEDGKDARRRGSVSGFILLNAVGLATIAPDRANLSRLKKKIAEAMMRRLRYRISEKTIDNSIWRTYRPVAHYWAAWLHGGSARGRFPCSPSEIGIFLSTAEAFRVLGESTRTPRSPSTILQPGEAVLLDPSIPIERISLSFDEHVTV